MWIWIRNTADKNNFFRVSDPNHFNADPDPAPLESGAKGQPLADRHQSSIFSLQASTMSVPGPPRLLYNKPLKLLTNFDFKADPDPAFVYTANPNQASKIKAGPDPDLEPWPFLVEFRIRDKHPGSARLAVPLVSLCSTCQREKV
jgi:hypothetical protein